MDEKVKEILAEALQIGDVAKRRAWLEQACAGEKALHCEVESLLEAYEQAGDFFAGATARAISGSASERPGSTIGRYQLLEQIGEGGFGTVWLAEQQEPVRRQVALKIIKLGMDTKEVVARFEAERQALALMDHPNIATVFDGGATDTGRPYFAMELVQGIPITQFCDAKKLSTRERLELFIHVCEAVQHAHQKGIIHRDLKPSNVLVTERDGRPVPKVIDFGVAKATQARLTDKTLVTHLHQWMGTPAYMSPEQAGLGSLDVDTRSDVYSLGVLLYELLTGRTPFDTQKLLADGYDAVMKVIREEEPPRPSTRLSTLSQEELTIVASRRGAEPAKLGRLVRGDLDWIVMRALEKDRQRRYESALSLARDVERHLRSQPVSAAAPRFLYRSGKFLRRNRGRLALATLAAAVLAVGVFGAKATLKWRSERAALRHAGPDIVFAAATSPNAESIRRLLSANHGLVRLTNSLGATPLIEAARAGQIEAVRLLIQSGANVRARDRSDWTALHSAAVSGQGPLALTLLQAGADPNGAASAGYTPLIVAAFTGAKEVVQVLLQHGAAVNSATQPEARTALHLASWMGHDDIVEMLLNRGALPNAKDQGRITPLHLAASPLSAIWDQMAHSEPTAYSAFAPEAVSKFVATALSGFRKAMPAAGNGHRRVAELLLAHGADPLATTLPGRMTPLLHAVFFTNQPVAEVLIACKSGLDVQGQDGMTPLNMASATGAEKIIAQLLAAGADPNLPDKSGFTPLNTAAEYGYVRVAEDLLAHGADPDLAPSLRGPGLSGFSGQSPLHTAAQFGRLEIVRLLLDKGARLNASHQPEHRSPRRC